MDGGRRSIVRCLVVVVAAIALVAGGCSDDDGAGDRDRTVAGTEVSVTASRYITIAAELTVTTPDDVRVEVTARSGDHVVHVPRTAAAGTEHRIPVVGMRAERDYDLEIALFDEAGEQVGTELASFTTGALPDDFLAFDFEADPERTAPGVTIVEVTPDGALPYLMAVDEEGEIVWYYRNTGTIGSVEPTPRGTLSSHYWPLGVREIDVLGNVVGNWQFAAPGGSDLEDQEQVIDEDLVGQIVDMAKGNEGDPDPVPIQAESFDLTSVHHEVWPMPDGNYLVLGTTVHQLTPEQRGTFCPDDPTDFDVTSDVVVEMRPSGEVVREWDLWNALSIDEVPGHELCGEDGPFASPVDRDWLHANAVVYDQARDAIIVSARHTNQIIALRHLDREGPQAEVLWTFGEGGSIPVEGDPPYYQHAPEVEDDGSILLFDNGNNRPGTAVRDPDHPTYSRAVRFAVDDSSADPADWTVTQTWEDRTEDVDGSALYARFLGDADHLENGNVLVTWGGIDMRGDDDYEHALIEEVVPSGASGGDVVLRMVIGKPGAEATVYRSERLPSLYFGPDWET